MHLALEQESNIELEMEDQDHQESYVKTEQKNGSVFFSFYSRLCFSSWILELSILKTSTAYHTLFWLPHLLSWVQQSIHLSKSVVLMLFELAQTVFYQIDSIVVYSS